VTNNTKPDAALLGRVLAVSPHLDDAVLSTGRLLAACAGAVVVTVLAGFPEPGLALTDWDRAHQADTFARVSKRTVSFTCGRVQVGGRQ